MMKKEVFFQLQYMKQSMFNWQIQVAIGYFAIYKLVKRAFNLKFKEFNKHR